LGALTEALSNWIKEILINGILSNFTNLFDYVNEQVSGVAGDIGITPMEWNSNVFNMIQNLSETVIMPIAGIVLTFIMTYELIQMIIDKNNLHDLDTWIFFKWVFKTFIAIIVITNTWDIVMGIFELAQNIVQTASGVISADTAIDISTVIADMEDVLKEMDVGELLGLWLQTFVVQIIMKALGIAIFIITFGRMLEIYMVTSIAPIPMATMANREWGQMGQNYLKSIIALAFQAFMIIVCVGIYAALVENITLEDDIMKSVWICLGYTVLLCFTLFKTGSLSKSLFSAH